jgi:hypothetical protein
MLRNICTAPHSIPALYATRRPSPLALPAVTILRMLFEALGESLAAYRHYEELRSRGVGHDSALRNALAPAPSRSGCVGLTPLWFAGRA